MGGSNEADEVRVLSVDVSLPLAARVRWNIVIAQIHYLNSLQRPSHRYRPHTLPHIHRFMLNQSVYGASSINPTAAWCSFVTAAASAVSSTVAAIAITTFMIGVKSLISASCPTVDTITLQYYTAGRRKMFCGTLTFA